METLIENLKYAIWHWKMCHADNEKSEIVERIEQKNQESISTLGKKGNG